MKTRNLVLVILSIAVFLIIVIGWNSASANSNGSQTQSSILYVKQGSSGHCSAWADACELQAALSLAQSGDQIWVAAGTYKPTAGSDRTATFQLIPGVAIYGGFPPEGGDWKTRDWETFITTLSGDIGTSGENYDNSYHVVTGSGVNATAILDGFNIVGGNADGGSLYDYGGGMYNYYCSPTLSNLTFSSNTAKYCGGGMYNDSGSPALNNVNFSGNSAGLSGGGLYNQSSSPTLTEVTFRGNAAENGGGMCNGSSSPTLTNVTFSSNEAGYGGGMYNDYSLPTLTNVTFSCNKAEYFGGGMYNDSGSPALNNVTFSGNSASYYGGGMYNLGSNPTLTNVTFSDNMAAYSGGGMYNNSYSNPTLVNTILWGNSPNQIYNDATSSTAATYSDIQGTEVYPGTGNINQDPSLLPLADNGGFTQTHALGAGSPAIDAGHPTIFPITDQRGFPRPVDGDADGDELCDMGAYEFGYVIVVNLVGSGSVSKDPDKPEYLWGDTVTLTPSSNPGWTFDHWSGDASGTENPLTITMDGSKNITAHFTQDEYTLTVSVDPPDSGSVTVDPVQITYHYGDLVTLTANPETGWSFAGWSGDATGADNPLIITIEGDTNITATFTQDEQEIYLPLILR